MIQIKKKFYLLKYNEVYFHCNSSFSNLWKLKKYSFLPEHHPLPFGCIRKYFHTVLINLQKTEEELLGKFRSTVKQNCRKAERMGMEVEFNQQLDQFLEFYNRFAQKKGIYQIPREIIQEFNTDQFIVCWVKFEGEILAAGLSLFDKKLSIAYDYLGASRRLDEHFNKSVVGLAGKLMKKEEILYYWKMGIKTYDLGGYAMGTTNKSLQGINEFKLSFGGEVAKLSNFKTIPFYILKTISIFLDRRYI
jgi:lipid II:glycine glycyltransferase (peptidoglycan interpeptide bridge formation enzyme)